MTSVLSWQNSTSFCPASFCTPRPNLTVIPGEGKIPWTRGAWWAAVDEVAQSQTQLKLLCMHACIGEGNGNQLQYSCLENPRDRGAWWAAAYGVAQSDTTEVT